MLISWVIDESSLWAMHTPWKCNLQELPMSCSLRSPRRLIWVEISFYWSIFCKSKDQFTSTVWFIRLSEQTSFMNLWSHDNLFDTINDGIRIMPPPPPPPRPESVAYFFSRILIRSIFCSRLPYKWNLSLYSTSKLAIFACVFAFLSLDSDLKSSTASDWLNHLV